MIEGIQNEVNCIHERLNMQKLKNFLNKKTCLSGRDLYKLELSHSFT